MAPPIMDPPNKGHNRNNLSITPKCSLSHSTKTFSAFKERTTSQKDKMAVFYLEVPLYMYILLLLLLPLVCVEPFIRADIVFLKQFNFSNGHFAWQERNSITTVL